ncbi:MAG: T9SS type A sorting domain-containing protein [Bacteroidales bacterium]|nr:T9SS type A sorting domain-containing protein [Bacteroidales bacterium]
MENLQLVEQGYLSATVAWRQNETPEQYQVSIGPVGNKPDSGAMFYTTDTFYTFTNLEPDTNYSVWVRKACRYITAGYDTIVWSDWSNEVVFTAVGIDEVEADGVRITSQRSSIVVEGAEGREVRVYDMLGREVTHSSVSVCSARNATGISLPNLGEQRRIAVPTAGIYMVRVGNLPTRKVAVLR